MDELAEYMYFTGNLKEILSKELSRHYSLLIPIIGTGGSNIPLHVLVKRRQGWTPG